MNDSTVQDDDLLPYLKEEKTGNPHETLFWRKLEESAARWNEYKMVQLENYGKVVYNLEYDISELNDLSNTDTTAVKN